VLWGEWMKTLAEAGKAAVYSALRADGLWLDVGSATVRVRSDAHPLALALIDVYRHFPFQPHAAWADLHVEVRSRRRKLLPWRSQVEFICDGARPFEPFPADTALPLFEWGVNWMIGTRLHHRLLLHAGAVARNDLAILMPAVPGAGKSTLTSALASRGWRLLSDEFAAIETDTGQVWPLIKPPVLKNESIGVFGRFAPQVSLGRVYPATRKGDVAHVAPLPDAVQARHRPARPVAIVLPYWQADAPAVLQPISPAMACSALAFNAFNYRISGESGFRAVARLARDASTWQLTYGQLEDAVSCLDGLHARLTASSQGALRSHVATEPEVG